MPARRSNPAAKKIHAFGSRGWLHYTEVSPIAQQIGRDPEFPLDAFPFVRGTGPSGR